MRYWFKSCPRCRRGDLHEEKDIYGPYIGCVQCGYIVAAGEEAILLGWKTALPPDTREVTQIAA